MPRLPVWKGRWSIKYWSFTVSSFIYYWLPAILYAAAIFFVSSIHDSFKPPTFPGNDKLFHVVEYGIFAWLWFRALVYGAKMERKRVALVAILITAVFGAVDEWYQSLNPTRSSDYMDFLADLSGGTIALVISMFTGRQKVPS